MSTPHEVSEPVFPLKYNCDAVVGMQKYIPDQAIDLIITDPPFGIDTKDGHGTYNRDPSKVIPGYVEVPKGEYFGFTVRWMKEAFRVLKDTGAMYVVSGWSNLRDVLNALQIAKLTTINHIIWKYQFGVVTKKKFVTSHYHILYVCRNDSKEYHFNRNCRFDDDEKDDKGRSLRYADMEDVWVINREYRPGEKKNRNQLPTALLRKMLLYSSRPGAIVLDPFAGSFSTCTVAQELGRDAIGIEINPNMF